MTASQGGVRAIADDGVGASTLLPLCPVCESDDAEPEAVVGRFEKDSEAALFLRCVACTTLYVNPPPVGASRFPPRESVALSRRWVRQRTASLSTDSATLLLTTHEAVDIRAEPDSYDFILLPFTLETSDDPRGLLRSVALLLRHSGTAVIVGSNPDSPTFETFGGRHWSGYSFPSKRQVLGVNALRHVCSVAGLRMVNARTLFSSEAWLSSLRNLLEDWAAPRWLVASIAGNWALPIAGASGLEGAYSLLGRGSLLAATLEKP